MCLLFLYSFDRLKSTLAEKCPGVVVGAEFTVSRVPLQQRRPTAFIRDSLGRVASTLMGVIIPLCSAAVKPHPVLSFPEQDRHGHSEASSWKIVKIRGWNITSLIQGSESGHCLCWKRESSEKSYPYVC